MLLNWLASSCASSKNLVFLISVPLSSMSCFQGESLSTSFPGCLREVTTLPLLYPVPKLCADSTAAPGRCLLLTRCCVLEVGACSVYFQDPNWHIIGSLFFRGTYMYDPCSPSVTLGLRSGSTIPWMRPPRHRAVEQLAQITQLESGGVESGWMLATWHQSWCLTTGQHCHPMDGCRQDEDV